MKQQNVKFTIEELNSIKYQMETMGATQENIDLVIGELSTSGNSTIAPKLPVGDKGIKIALKRKGNKLGVGFIVDIKKGSDKVVTLGSFTGNSLDYAVLSEVATKNGYSLTAL